MRDSQHTVAGVISFSGIGAHSGKAVQMSIEPADANTGIVFIRSDLRVHNIVLARFDHVVAAEMCTVIANEYGVSVSTIEHLMSALWGCGVDNAVIQVNNCELPIMDGSSACFIEAIKQTGVIQLDSKRKFLEITKSICIAYGDKSIIIEPSNTFSVRFTINFANKHIGCQSYYFNEQQEFEDTVARARTFGFVKDLHYLQSKGLAQGVSLENVIGLDDSGVMNKEGLRYDNEFVRHKVLDCIGDLYLAGVRIKGQVTAIRSGHALNNLLLRRLFDSNAYVYAH